MFNPNIHHRRSIRLKEYDYSQEGVYFVTICTEKKECLFGDIVNGKMVLNDAGKIVDQCWLEIPQHFSNVQLHEHIVMPNHVHGIIEITNRGVGANYYSPNDDTNGYNKRANNHSPLRPAQTFRSPSKTVGSIVRSFKIGATKWFRQNTDIYVVWQRNYYEHIIRNGNSYQKIAEYIVTNPAKWADDKFYVAPK